jgi:small subunit ribosomal protein S1
MSVHRNRLGNVNNGFQGKFRHVLCVCSAGLLRSPTLAEILSQPPYNFNTRAVGIAKEFALIPIDMLSVSRIDHPRARLREGQELRVVLRSREPDKLTFSLKELLGTWQQNAAGFSSGETVPGVVRSVEPYGVFVELTPNLAGLAEPSAALEPGQPVAVYVKSILPEKMKIKLVVVEAFDPPAPVTPLTYYVDGTRMDRWVYSTPTAPRQTVTDFAALRSQEKSTL